MKKYTSRATKWLIVVSLICGVVLLTGIILAFAGIGNIGLPIGLILLSKQVKSLLLKPTLSKAMD